MYEDATNLTAEHRPSSIQDDIEAMASEFITWNDVDNTTPRSLMGLTYQEPMPGNECVGIFQDVMPDIMASPTSPGSVSVQTLVDSDNDNCSVSTAFHPTAYAIPSVSPDIVLKTSDRVLFCAHRSSLDKASNNAFGKLLANAGIVTVDEVSHVLNIILHAIYDMPIAPFNPTFDALVSAVDRFPIYGLSPPTLITPPDCLFTLLYSHAPPRPMEVYILAAHHGIDALAVLASGHLLSCNVRRITEDMAEQMGGQYLKRLVFLQLERMAGLKDILCVRPQAHGCGSDSQRAWALASAMVVDEAKPDLSPPLLVSSMKLCAGNISCNLCRGRFEEALNVAAGTWSQVKATI